MSTLLLVSVTEEQAQELVERGPRRDFVELARACDGMLLYQHAPRRRRGLLGRLLGPHIRQAWRAAGRLSAEDVVFADSEHVGIPLLAFLALRRKRPTRVVMLGHLPGRPWKRALLRLVSRLRGPGTLLVHSVRQAELVRPALGRRWELQTIPYQVDTDYWQGAPQPPMTDGPPLLVAVGSEHRDYETLVRAVEGLPVRVCIAAGSHWARSTASASALPSNVEYLEQPLPFRELRPLYERAAAVVVPLVDVPNQAGITTLLEAMSMGRPVIVSASAGQLECVRGPLVRADGTLDDDATDDRGPHHFGTEETATTGLYVPVGDVAAMRAAITRIVEDEPLRRELGAAARESAVRSFGIDAFTDRLVHAMTPDVATKSELPAAAPSESARTDQ